MIGIGKWYFTAKAGIVMTAILLSMAGWARAQVAAPLLNPLALESGNVFNPAILPWAGASRVGAGVISIDVEDTTAGVTTPNASGDGVIVQARLIGETFSVAAEALSLSLDVDPASGGTGSVEIDNTLLAGALRIGEVLSFGVSQQEEEFADPNGVSKDTIAVGGVVIRLAEVFYLGLAAGTNSFEFSQILPPFTVEADQDVTRIGVAYHMRNGENGLHLEVYREEIDSAPIGAFFLPSDETNGFTLEVLFSNILLGVLSLSSESIDATTGTVIEEEDETTVSIAWAPEEGLLLAIIVNENEFTDPSTGDVMTIDAAGVAVGWAF